jgi:tetratricopeptide (TPR) repeat protein
METSSFLIWLLFIGTIVTIALSSMIWAYLGSGSRRIRFPDPILVPETLPVPTLNPEAATLFQQSIEAYQAQQYRQAADRLMTALRLDPDFAEAHHNRGRAIANLRQDNEAASCLLRAGECYLQQENTASYEQVKQDLQTLKA